MRLMSCDIETNRVKDSPEYLLVYDARCWETATVLMAMSRPRNILFYFMDFWELLKRTRLEHQASPMLFSASNQWVAYQKTKKGNGSALAIDKHSLFWIHLNNHIFARTRMTRRRRQTPLRCSNSIPGFLNQLMQIWKGQSRLSAWMI